MARLAKYSQTPDELKRYSVEYSDWLDGGETLVSVSFEITPATTPPLVVPSSEIVNGDTNLLTNVRFFVSGGVAKTNYKIVVDIVTSGGQVKQDSILFEIRDAV